MIVFSEAILECLTTVHLNILADNGMILNCNLISL